MTRARRILAVATVAAAALLAACSAEAPPQPPAAEQRPSRVATAAQVRSPVDAFGIENIRPTLPGGTIWTSTWEEADRSFDGVDPQDAWFDADHGEASYRVEDGRLYISGEIPRMYVYPPAMDRQWGDVEVTMYFKRVEDSSIPYAGMTIVARSNHLDTESGRFPCDTRGYGGRMRYDGYTDFSKETAFPQNAAVSSKPFWTGELPEERWIGLKFIVFDAPDGVHLELWTDLSDGEDGGDWRRVNHVVDDGNLFGDAPCAPGIDPRMALTNSPDRPGSETGRPNLTVWFRSDGVGEDGLVYKWGSIREIEVPPASSRG